MKRKAALLLSAVMATSSLPMTAYAANFKDIQDVPWAEAATVINSVADKGLLSGYQDGTFRARNNVTYCEAMQMVYNAMLKTGAAKGIDAVDAYSYFPVLNTYRVPSWCQMAVAYGLKNNIIDMQMVATKFAGGTQAATREDVALLFGNAMGQFYDKEKDAAEAKEFVDYLSISVNNLVQIDLLKHLGIVSGDNYNRFNPQNNINRAEMAVMLNKTYAVLTDGVSVSGEISDIMVNEDKYFYFEVKLDGGGREEFQATLDEVPVYVGNTSQTIPMSRLNKGDKIALVRSGNKIKAIHQMNAVTAQGKYDITGYVNSYKDSTLSLDNENTGETTKYKFKSGVKIYVENKKIDRSKLADILSENKDKFAYAGMYTSVEREKNAAGKYEDVIYVDEIYITFTEEYVTTGEVKDFTTSSVTMKLTGSSKEKTYFFASGCEFYIGDSKESVSALKKLADSGTAYAKVTLTEKEKAKKVILTEDAFEDGTQGQTSKIYKVKKLSNREMVLEVGGAETTFTFGSANPLDNIRFYQWDSEDKTWDAFKNAERGIDFFENADAKKDFYCKIVRNSGGKLSEIYLSTKKSAWNDSDESKTEKKGTVASLVDDVLQFKTSTTKYTLKNKYEEGDIRIDGFDTQSKKLLTRLANDDDMELYAEIVANGKGEVLEVVAVLKAAEGKLVEYNQDERYIKIATSDGGEYKINTASRPKLTDADDRYFTLDDIATSKYIGQEIKLGFGSSGTVNAFTLPNGSVDSQK